MKISFQRLALSLVWLLSVHGQSKEIPNQPLEIPHHPHRALQRFSQQRIRTRIKRMRMRMRMRMRNRRRRRRRPRPSREQVARMRMMRNKGSRPSRNQPPRRGRPTSSPVNIEVGQATEDCAGCVESGREWCSQITGIGWCGPIGTLGCDGGTPPPIQDAVSCPI